MCEKYECIYGHRWICSWDNGIKNIDRMDQCSRCGDLEHYGEIPEGFGSVAYLPISAREQIKGVKFINSRAWQDLRLWVLTKARPVCEICYDTDGPFHVDHVYPRSKYPSLGLTRQNLQLLCSRCNKMKRDQVLPGSRDRLRYGGAWDVIKVGSRRSWKDVILSYEADRIARQRG